MNLMHLLKLFFLLNLIVLLAQIDGQNACLEEERRGLLELKSFFKLELGLDGSDHLLPSWVDDPKSDCCGWERVTCNSTTGRVVKLSLFNIGESEIFDAFVHCDEEIDRPLSLNITLFQAFKKLRTLNLSYNYIRLKEKQGSIGLLRLEQLETLDFYYNSLTSSNLHSLRKLKSLKNLILPYNCLEAPFPAQDLIHFGGLEVLDLSDNNLGGGIPQDIGKLSSLKALYLARISFNGSLPVPGFCELRRLQELGIHENSFEGTLPPCLSNLTSLEILDLHDNLLSGSIGPNSIPSPKFLQYIDISSNDFEGSFSLSSIFNHSKLEEIVLGSRENKLQIDNDNQAGNSLFQLKALVFSNCNMKNSPNFLLNQHRLRLVDLSHNKLNGMFPSWLVENNTDLKLLNLRNNYFIGKLDQLPRQPISRMVYLDVSYNHLDGYLPKDLGMILPNLKVLYLSHNYFEGELPPSIGGMRKLRLLDFSFNYLSGEVPKELANCNDLYSLTLNDNNFRGEFFSTHLNLSNIQVLRLGNDQFTGSLPTNKEFRIDMLIFDVSNNNMAGKIPSGIDAEVLSMRNNHFEGPLPCEIFSGAHIIDISHNFLSEPLPSCLDMLYMPQNHSHGSNFFRFGGLVFRNYSALWVLNLRNNSLSGNISALIDAFPSLKILLLGNNHLSGLIPRQLCQLTKISILDLSNNSFSGSIPSCLNNVIFGATTNSGDNLNEVLMGYWFDKVEVGFGNENLLHKLHDTIDFSYIFSLEYWKEIEVDFVTKNNLFSYKGDIVNYMSGLDFSCNNLTGEIPQSLGKLLSIHALNLSHNNLTGSIPVSFSNLTQLESLDFSYNSLSGKIPSELVNLNFSEVFSVAHNNLSGRIPDKGQFATFDSSCYEGNPFLSGLPSKKNHTKVVEMPLPSDEDKEKCYYFVVDARRRLATNFNN